MRGAVSVEANWRQLQGALTDLQRRELPFVGAQTLTRGASRSVKAVRRELPKRYQIRKRGLLRGWQSRKAKKADWPRLEAWVGSKDALWVDHEFGRVRKARRGRAMAVPTRVLHKKRTKGGRVRKPWQPRTLFEKGKAYRTKQGGKAAQIRLRRAQFKRLSIAYHLVPRVRIRKTLGARELVKREAERTWQRQFPVLMDRAVRSTQQRNLSRVTRKAVKGGQASSLIRGPIAPSA